MVMLLPMADRHVDQTYRWLANSPALRQQVDTLAIPSPDGNRAYWRRNLSDESRVDFAIETADGKHAGNCGLTHLDRHRGKAELWIYLGGNYGAGIGSQALEQLIGHAFSKLGLRRLYLRVVETNERAVAFYKRAGFAIEGRLRGDTVQDGKAIDSILMSLLASEHKAGRPSP
jgi:RimJ/RimL family protein N-acetyltransferase